MNRSECWDIAKSSFWCVCVCVIKLLEKRKVSFPQKTKSMGFSYWNGTRYGKLNWPLLRHCFPWISSEARETCHGSWRNYRHQARDWFGSDLSKKHLSLSRINCNMRTSGRLVRPHLGELQSLDIHILAFQLQSQRLMAEEAVGVQGVEISGDLFLDPTSGQMVRGFFTFNTWCDDASISLSQWLNLKPLGSHLIS